MRKLTVLIDGESKALDLPESFSWHKHILVKKATIFWEYYNVKGDATSYTIKKNGLVVGNEVVLDVGYWTFKDIAKKLSPRGITLAESSVDGKCIIVTGGEFESVTSANLKMSYLATRTMGSMP